MDKIIRPSRVAAVLIGVALILIIYFTSILKMEREGASAMQAETFTYSTYTLQGSRGDILDRNGVLLASSHTEYSLGLRLNDLRASGDINGEIMRLLEICRENQVEHIDTFPMTDSAPWAYDAIMSSANQVRLPAYIEFVKQDADISAEDLYYKLRERYGIDSSMSDYEARQLIGIRYELDMRNVLNIDPYVFAENVTPQFIAIVLEKGCVGVDVRSNWVREYHTRFASQTLGYIGRIGDDERDYYLAKGYNLNEYVGKTGAEAAFEDYLHGESGTRVVTRDSDGRVADVTVKSEATAGDNVYLTLDIALQEVTENALQDTIIKINSNKKEDEEAADGGAVVVRDVHNGEVLACASYPSYDMALFDENFSMWAADESKPLYNRATMGIYNPGSTFKMVTALAGLWSGGITPDTYVHDETRYTAYPDYQPRCWSSVSHGDVNVELALQYSCNYFFYWLGDHIGADAIANAAAQFGLGEKTGIEVSEAVGSAASPENKKAIKGEQWYAADTLLSAIGQSINLFTPLQIANYVATIANNGTLYRETIIKRAMSSDYGTLTYESKPEILHKIDDPNGYLSIVRAGMEDVIKYGTAREYFETCSISVAAKTGTTQSDTAQSNSGVFVCYAPTDNPQIAIAVVVEQGGSGAATADVARKIIEYYFNEKTEVTYAKTENTLVQ